MGCHCQTHINYPGDVRDLLSTVWMLCTLKHLEVENTGNNLPNGSLGSMPLEVAHNCNSLQHATSHQSLTAVNERYASPLSVHCSALASAVIYIFRPSTHAHEMPMHLPRVIPKVNHLIRFGIGS